MSDDKSAADQPGGQTPPAAMPEPASVPRMPFPATRLLYAAGFAVVAWFVFWITLILALAQFVVVAINGHLNAELKSFSLDLVQYLRELLAYITFARDEQPFPIGPFPKHG